MRQDPLHDLIDLIFPARIGKREQGADGYRLGGHLAQSLLEVLGQVTRVASNRSWTDSDPQLRGHQGNDSYLIHVVEGRSILSSDLDEILKSGVGQKDGPRSPPFEQGIRSHGGPVDELGTCGIAGAKCGHHAIALVVGRRRDLRRPEFGTIP
jgi:hypothetical protein